MNGRAIFYCVLGASWISMGLTYFSWESHFLGALHILMGALYSLLAVAYLIPEDRS